MKKGILTSLMFFLLKYSFAFNINPGKKPGAPIDTYQIVLIVAAVLLTVGVVAYKKLSLKKA